MLMLLRKFLLMCHCNQEVLLYRSYFFQKIDGIAL
jgi:hypothetical protein